MQVDRHGKTASFQFNTTHYSGFKDASANMSRSLNTISMTPSRVARSGEKAYNFEVTLKDDEDVHAEARQSRSWGEHLNKGTTQIITITEKTAKIGFAVTLVGGLVILLIVYVSKIFLERPVPTQIISHGSCDAMEPDCFVTYWAVNSKCPNRPWNPTEKGESDGVQIASVTDGVVDRIPTTSTCSHAASASHGSKEWVQFKFEMIHVVNYNFDKQPSAEEVDRYKEQYGLKAVRLGKPGWGGYLLTVKDVFTEFHVKPPETKEDAQENA